MKIKSTVWIPCIVIPLVLVLVWLRSEVNLRVAAQEAAQRAAGVAVEDRGTAKLPVPKPEETDAPQVGSDDNREKPDEAAATKVDRESGTSSVGRSGGGSRTSSGRRPRNEQPFEDVTHHIYRLKNQKALELADALQKMYPKLRFSAILEDNAIVLTGGTPQMDERLKAFIAFSERTPEEITNSGYPPEILEFFAGNAPEMLAETTGTSVLPAPPSVIVTLQANGAIGFQDSADVAPRAVTIPELAKLVSSSRRIVLQASKTVEYARVAEVLSMLRLNDQSDATIMLRQLEEPMSLVIGSSNESSDGKSGASNAAIGFLTVYGDGTLAWESNAAFNRTKTTQRERFTFPELPGAVPLGVVPMGSNVRLRVGNDVASSVVIKVLEALRERKASVVVANWSSPPEKADAVDQKLGDDAPGTTDRPLGPKTKAEVRIKDVPTQVHVKKAEVVYTESYPVKPQDAARIAEELKKIVPELEVVLDPQTDSINVLQMTAKQREFVTEVVQRLSAARQQPLTPQPNTPSTTKRDLGNADLDRDVDFVVDGGLLARGVRIRPDIAGHWDGWGRVELRETSSGVYQGSYTGTFGTQPGMLKLEWSAEDGRYHGEWKEGNGDRFGELTARRTDQGNVILGAFAADANSKINPGKPKLADFEWTRVIPGATDEPSNARSTRPNESNSPTAPSPANAQPGSRFYPLVGAATLQPDGALTIAQKRYREAEEQARRVGLGLRLIVPPGPRTPDERQSLKNSVTTAFDARQALLRQELAEFRNRLERLAKTLEARERDKAAIIQRRVDELLNPNLNWDATGNPRDTGMMGSAAGGSTERPMTARGVGLNSDSSFSGTLSLPTPATRTGTTVPNPQPAARANDFRVGDFGFSVGTIDKGLEFLSQYPRFSGLSLDMSETQFRAFLEQQKLAPQLSIPRDGQLNYSVPLGDGNRLTVMFGLDGKCRGIEPISGDRPSTILPQPATPAPVRAEKVAAKIFRLEQVDAASVAKTLQELAKEKPFSARISEDVTSNSVIVFADPDDMLAIEAVIKRLDKAPESSSPKAQPKPGSDSSPAAGTGDSNPPNDAPLSSELKSWQGRWLLVSAEINGQEQKRDEVSTQSITVSGDALKIASRHPETKEYSYTDGVLKLSSLPGGTKAFTFEMPSPLIAHELATEVGEDRAMVITYQMPSPLNGSYEFRDGKLAVHFYEQGSKNAKKRPDKFKTTPGSGLHLYHFDKVAEPDAAAPAEAETSPKPNVPASDGSSEDAATKSSTTAPPTSK